MSKNRNRVRDDEMPRFVPKGQATGEAKFQKRVQQKIFQVFIAYPIHSPEQPQQQSRHTTTEPLYCFVHSHPCLAPCDQNKEKIRSVFKEFDDRKDGTVGAVEFSAGLTSMGINTESRFSLLQP